MRAFVNWRVGTRSSRLGGVVCLSPKSRVYTENGRDAMCVWDFGWGCNMFPGMSQLLCGDAMF